MKIKNFLPTAVALFFAAILVLFTSVRKAEPNDYSWLKRRLEVLEAFTIEVLEAMPDDDYYFKDSEDQRTFATRAYLILIVSLTLKGPFLMVEMLHGSQEIKIQSRKKKSFLGPRRI